MIGVHINSAPSRFCGNIFLWGKKNWKVVQIAPSMDLWKYGPILTIEKSITIIWLNFHGKDFLFEFLISYYNLYWITITHLEWKSIQFSHFLILNLADQSLFLDFKSSLLLTYYFFSKNNYMNVFIMKLLV